jgi:GTPase SAR1 family protein
MQNKRMQTKKIVLVGPSCGKTTWVSESNKVETHMFDEDKVIDGLLTNNGTLGVEITPFDVTNGVMNVWEIGGRHRGSNFKDFYCDANGVIIYYDNENSLKMYRDEVALYAPNVQVEEVMMSDKTSLIDVLSRFNDFATYYPQQQSLL